MKAPTTKNVYISACCGEKATKAPCSMERGQRVSRDLGNQPKDREASLGKWRCSKCRRRCKVSVTKQEVKHEK